jgi:hypothetical protein
MIQSFAIPVSGTEDADARSPRPCLPAAMPEPVQGWEQWCEDILDVIRANIHNHFNQERHLVARKTYKERRPAALAEW